MKLDLVKDSYDRKARLYPAILVLFPPAAFLGSFVSLTQPKVEAVLAGTVSLGGAFLLTQLARDAGKRSESELFLEWGGMPSVVLLRHLDPRHDPITKARYHSKLCLLVSGTVAPTQANEAACPPEADATYKAWSNFLRVATRDPEKYALLFKENINYGYRRNVYGLRATGLAISMLCLMSSLLAATLTYHQTRHLATGFLFSLSVALFFGAFWLFVVSPSWVRIAGDAYAERLVETTDSLADLLDSDGFC